MSQSISNSNYQLRSGRKNMYERWDVGRNTSRLEPGGWLGVNANSRNGTYPPCRCSGCTNIERSMWDSGWTYGDLHARPSIRCYVDGKEVWTGPERDARGRSRPCSETERVSCVGYECLYPSRLNCVIASLRLGLESPSANFLSSKHRQHLSSGRSSPCLSSFGAGTLPFLKTNRMTLGL